MMTTPKTRHIFFTLGLGAPDAEVAPSTSRIARRDTHDDARKLTFYTGEDAARGNRDMTLVSSVCRRALGCEWGGKDTHGTKARV